VNGAVRTIVPRIWYLLPLSVRRRILWLAHPRYTVGVSAVLFNDRDEILYLRHRYRERRGWELPGGLVKRGEKLEEALRREIWEETGYHAEILSFVAADISPSLHVDVCYAAHVLDGMLTVDPKEILEAQFFARHELPSTLEAAQRETIEQAVRMRRFASWAGPPHEFS